MDSDEGGCSRLGPQPDTAPAPPVVPDSGRQPPTKRGDLPMPMTSVHPEASDNLVEALQSASIVEEHCTLMGTAVEKVWSAKSGLNEAFTGLLRGFEDYNVIS